MHLISNLIRGFSFLLGKFDYLIQKTKHKRWLLSGVIEGEAVIYEPECQFPGLFISGLVVCLPKDCVGMFSYR